MTVLEVLQSTTAYFKKRGVESARLNAEHLLAHSLGRKRIELYLEFERALAEAELAPLRELVRRRGQGEPLQHLLGNVEFCGRIFRCDRRALIPRPETEEFVELLRAQVQHAPLKIADSGTGSGVIALSLAAQFPEADVHAIDLSAEALALAQENAAQLGLAGRVQFHQADLLPPGGMCFDLIAANLPYVPATERDTLTREVLHDPEMALFGGADGEEVVRRLIALAPARLAPGGLLALEIGIGQSERLTACLAEHDYREISARQDYAGVTRFLLARHG